MITAAIPSLQTGRICGLGPLLLALLIVALVAAPEAAAGRQPPEWNDWSVSVVDPPGLLDAQVLALAEDRDGGIWFGTLSGGASRFSPSDRSWTTYADARVLDGGAVLAIHEDREGGLWFAQENGIAGIEPGTGRWAAADLPDRSVVGRVGAEWIGEDSRGWLWFVDFVDGVSLRDPGTGEWLRPPKGDGGTPYFASDIAEDGEGQVWLVGDGGAVTSPAGQQTFTSVVDWEVDQVHVGRSGWVWLVGMGMQVERVWPGTGARDVVRSPSDDHIGPWDPTALLEDRRGDLWVGTLGKGLWRYDTAAHAWEDLGLADSVGGISAIHEDRRGRVWIGTRGEGLMRWDPATGVWVRWTREVGRGCTRIEVLLEAANGRIWVATAGGGVSVFDPDGGTWSTLPLHPHGGLPGRDQRLATAGDAGDLWFAANSRGVSERSSGWYGGGLTRYERSTGSWETVDVPLDWGFSSVNSFHSAANGDVWLGWNGGWLRRTSDSGLWIAIEKPAGSEEERVGEFLETPDGEVWSHVGSAIVRLDGAVDGHPRTTHLLGDGLSGPRVLGLGREPNGALLAETSGGFLRLSEGDGGWQPWSSAGPTTDIGEVAHRFRGPRGRPWASTWDGDLHRQDDSGGSWTRFARPRGLRGVPYTAPMVDREGGIWIGYGMASVRYSADGARREVYGSLDGVSIPSAEGFVEEAGGAIWALGYAGATRLTVGDEPGRPLSLDGQPADTEQAAIGGGEGGGILCWARPAGLSLTHPSGALGVAFGPTGEWATALDGSPEGCWAGHLLSGLVHVDRAGRLVRLGPADGLPDARVLDISQLPGIGEPIAWVATDRGAALVSVEDGVLLVVGSAQGGSPGAVDAAVALQDGGAVLAYNRFPSRYAPDSPSAGLRAQAHLRRVSPDGHPTEAIPVPDGQVTDLAVDARGWVWVATDVGAYVLADDGLIPVAIPAVAAGTPVRHVAARSEDPTRSVYLGLDGDSARDARVCRYRHRDFEREWPWDLEWPRAVAGESTLDALDLSADGEVVLLTQGVLRRIVPMDPVRP